MGAVNRAAALLDQHRRLNGAILTVTPVDRSRP